MMLLLLKFHHFEQKKLSFDDFLMTTWEVERKKRNQKIWAYIFFLPVSWNPLSLLIGKFGGIFRSWWWGNCNIFDFLDFLRSYFSFLVTKQVSNQGYYNTGWFNSKIRSRANLLICQQTNIKAKLKCFSDKVTDFWIDPTFNSRNLDNKLSYEKITLAGMGVEVNHETLISNSWSFKLELRIYWEEGAQSFQDWSP